MFLKTYFIFDSFKEKKYFCVHDPSTKSGHKFLKIAQKTQGIEDTNHFIFMWHFSLLEEQPFTKIQSDSFRKPITPESIWTPHLISQTVE